MKDIEVLQQKNTQLSTSLAEVHEHKFQISQEKDETYVRLEQIKREKMAVLLDLDLKEDEINKRQKNYTEQLKYKNEQSKKAELIAEKNIKLVKE